MNPTRDLISRQKFICFPSSGRSFISILNCRTANFSRSKNSNKSLKNFFQPCIFFWTRWTFSGRDQICREKFAPFSFFRSFLFTTKHQHFRQTWQSSHSAFRPFENVQYLNCSKLPRIHPLDPHSTSHISHKMSFWTLDPWILHKN